MTGAECKRTHTQTHTEKHTQTQSANRETQTSRGFVVLSGFVFPTSTTAFGVSEADERGAHAA